MLEYRKVRGGFQLIVKETGEIREELLSVAIGYCIDTEGDFSSMHRHGRSDFVMKWFDAFPVKEYALEPFMIESAKWDVEELNKILQITGYIKVVHDRVYAERDTTPDDEWDW